MRHQVGAWLRFVLAPLVDGWTGFSLTRLIAVACVVFAGVEVYRRAGVTANVVWLLTVALAAAFGKATFMAIASRGSWTGMTTDTTTRAITEHITTRRTASDIDGAEPAP